MTKQIAELKVQAVADSKITIKASNIADETNNAILATKARRERENKAVIEEACALEEVIGARVPHEKSGMKN